MINFLCSLFFLSALCAPTLGALSPYLVVQGGTGKATFTSAQLLYGNGTNALSSVATTTLGGTANQVSISNSPVVVGSAGAVVTLPNHVIFPGNFQVGNSTTTNATTTSLDIGGTLTFNGVTASTWSAFCTTITGGAGLCDGADATGSATWAFTPTTHWGQETQATTSALFLQATPFSLFASSTAQFQNASTTDKFTSGGSTWLTTITSAIPLTGADGLVSEYAGTTCTNQFVRALSALGAATCATITSTDVDSTITPSARTITIAGTANQLTSSAGAQDLTANRTWTLSLPSHVIFPGNFFVNNSTTTNATTTGAVNLTTFTSALLQTDAEGDVAEYAGTSCTNQFPRSLSALGIATCATVGTADVAGLDISDDTNLTATWPVILTGDALSWGGLATSSAIADTEIIYGTAVNTVDSESTFTYNASADRITTLFASTTAVSGTNSTWSGIVDAATGIFSSILRAPYGASPTVSTNGDIGIDSTSNQFKYQSGSATKVLGNGNFYPALTYATSTAWVGTTTIPLGTAYVGETWNGVQCFTDTGTLNVSFYDGTNRMNMFNASTTVGTVTLSTNNTFTAAEKRYVDVGTPATSPTKISCTVSKSLTAD